MLLQAGAPKEDKAKTKATARSIANGNNEEAYLQASLAWFDEVAAAVLRQLRAAFGIDMPQAAHGITDWLRATLVLLGGAGPETPMHSDWATADNVLVAVGPLDWAGVLIAVWDFLNPVVGPLADKLLKERWPAALPKGLSGKVYLPAEVLLDLTPELEAEAARAAAEQGEQLAPAVVRLEQRAGQRMHIPAGWVAPGAEQAAGAQGCLGLLCHGAPAPLHAGTPHHVCTGVWRVHVRRLHGSGTGGLRVGVEWIGACPASLACAV